MHISDEELAAKAKERDEEFKKASEETKKEFNDCMKRVFDYIWLITDAKGPSAFPKLVSLFISFELIGIDADDKKNRE